MGEAAGPAQVVWHSGGPSDPAGRHAICVTHDRFEGLFFVLVFDSEGSLDAFTVQCSEPDVAMPPSVGPQSGRNRGQLTARSLRTMPLGELTTLCTDDVRRRVMDAPTFFGDVPDPAVLERTRLLATSWARGYVEHARPGPKGRDLRDLALIAAGYVECLGSPKPVEMLARQLGLSVKRTTNLVYKARKASLLSPTKKGRAGGELTSKAIALLKENDDGPR
jgi:hypothetical protein